MLAQSPEVWESRNTLGSTASPPFRSSTSKKESKKKRASELETTKEDHRAVGASARPATVLEPVVERKKESRKRKERDGAIDLECSTAVDTPGPKKKRKKERGEGKEREKLAISEATLVEAMPVRADENTQPNKRKRTEDGIERNEAKAARKARKAEQKLEKVSDRDRSMVLTSNVSLSYAFDTNP